MQSVENADLRSRIEILETLVRIRQSGGSSIAAFTSFLWRPGGVAGGNVYTTWPSLVAAVAAVNGPRVIGVDTDLGAAIIPAGNWDLSPPNVSGQVVFSAASKLTFSTQITIANAAVTIHGWSGIVGIVLVNQSTANVITGTQEFSLDRSTIFHSALAAGAAFIRTVGGGAVSAIFLSEFSIIGTTDGGSDAIQAGGALCTVHVGEDCVIQSNMLSGPGGFLNVFLAGVDCQYGLQPAAATVIPKGGRQTGIATITGSGKTNSITTDDAGNPIVIGAVVRILVTLHDPVTDALTVKYGVLGPPDMSAAPTPTGSFKISALTALGGGDVNVNDRSTLYWEVTNPGP